MTAPVEPPLVHPPTAHRRIDLIVPVAALFVSLVSILIAWYSATVEAQMARQNERMVQASSLPRLTERISTVSTQSGLDRVTFSVENGGVGPAEIRGVEILVSGKPVRNAEDLLSRFRIPGGELSLQSLTNAMLRPGETADYFDLRASPPIAGQVREMVNVVRQKQIAVHLCYCSVFDECWQVGGIWSEPEPIKECTRDEPREFTPNS